MRTLTLYSTSACHLCDIAKDVVLPELDKHQLSLEEIDISESDELMERYGVRIPVLGLDDRELGWPFDRVQVLAFMTHYK